MRVGRATRSNRRSASKKAASTIRSRSSRVNASPKIRPRRRSRIGAYATTSTEGQKRPGAGCSSRTSARVTASRVA
jgi:hypothetical protein